MMHDKAKKSVTLLHTVQKCSIVQLNAPKLTIFAFDAITHTPYALGLDNNH